MTGLQGTKKRTDILVSTPKLALVGDGSRQFEHETKGLRDRVGPLLRGGKARYRIERGVPLYGIQHSRIGPKVATLGGVVGNRATSPGPIGPHCTPNMQNVCHLHRQDFCKSFFIGHAPNLPAVIVFVPTTTLSSTSRAHREEMYVTPVASGGPRCSAGKMVS